MAKTKDIPGEMVTVSCDNHREELASGLWNFFQSSYAVDFVTQWGGRSILTHRLILDVFLSPEKLGPSGRGALPEKPSGSDLDRQSCLACLVEFLYTGKVTIHKEQLPNLLEAAQESDFKMLVKAVESATAEMIAGAIRPDTIKKEPLPEDEGALESTEDLTNWPKDDPETVDTNHEDYLFLNPQMDDLDESEFINADVDATVEPTAAEPDCQHDAGVIGSIMVDHPQPTISGDHTLNRSRNFKCDYCEKRFHQSRDLEKHTRVHTTHRPFKCRHCPKSFAYFVSLKGHLRFNHSEVRNIPLPELQVEPQSDHQHAEDVHVCPVCGKSFTQQAWLTRHMLTHTGTEAYRCHICSKSFSYKQSLSNHIRSHVGTKYGDLSGLIIAQQGASSVGESTSAGTLKIGHGATSAHLDCMVCGKQLLSVKSLRLHERIHFGFKPYTCSYCPMTFHKKARWDLHSRTHFPPATSDETLGDSFHLEMPTLPADTTIFPVIPPPLLPSPLAERRFNCSVCRKNFSSSAGLSMHFRLHTGVRPYKCGHCERTFTRKDHRDIHVRTHTGEKPYKCPVCPKTYAHSTSLKEHSTTHAKADVGAVQPAEDELEVIEIRQVAPVKPSIFRCNVCWKTFSNSWNLRSHSRVHVSVDKIFRCSFCEKTFDCRANMIRHMRCHTGRTPEVGQKLGPKKS